jgi:hypothetical protein
MRGPTLPVAVLVRLRLVEVGVLAYDRAIHSCLVISVWYLANINVLSNRFESLFCKMLIEAEHVRNGMRSHR